METNLTPEHARQLTDYTQDFQCDLKANYPNIKFLKFRVRDIDSNFVLFEVQDDDAEGNDTSNKEEETNGNRIIKYHLGPDFLDLKNIGTELTFSVGNYSVKNLVMIERHYFKGKLIKSFEFKFDFCIPNSVNNWETIYNIPEIDQKTKEEMIESPWETKSDSFYFVEEKLVMHHKALYNYSNFD